MKYIKTIAILCVIISLNNKLKAQSALDGHLAAITEIKPKAGFENDIREATAAIQAAAIKESGCLLFNLNTRENEANTIVLFEVFKDKTALEAHKKQPHTIRFGKQLEGKCAYNNVIFLDVVNTFYKK